MGERTFSREIRIFCYTNVTFSNVKDLAKNEKHEAQPSWEDRPESGITALKKLFDTMLQ